MNPRLFLVPFVAFTVVALVACGGGKKNNSSSSSSAAALEQLQPGIDRYRHSGPLARQATSWPP